MLLSEDLSGGLLSCDPGSVCPRGTCLPKHIMAVLTFALFAFMCHLLWSSWACIQWLQILVLQKFFTLVLYFTFSSLFFLPTYLPILLGFLKKKHSGVWAQEAGGPSDWISQSQLRKYTCQCGEHGDWSDHGSDTWAQRCTCKPRPSQSWSPCLKTSWRRCCLLLLHKRICPKYFLFSFFSLRFYCCYKLSLRLSLLRGKPVQLKHG